MLVKVPGGSAGGEGGERGGGGEGGSAGGTGSDGGANGGESGEGGEAGGNGGEGDCEVKQTLKPSLLIEPSETQLNAEASTPSGPSVPE